MKIAIIGYSGSGKSTLCRFISDYYKINKLHLDSVQFVDDWEVRQITEQEDRVSKFLEDNEEWVIDGNYSHLFLNQRLNEANKIIFMDFNRFNCFFRVIKRYIKYHNKTREDLNGNCKEKLDLEFIWWVLYEGRDKSKFESVKNKYPNKLITISNQKQLDLFMNNISLQ